MINNARSCNWSPKIVDVVKKYKSGTDFVYLVSLMFLMIDRLSKIEQSSFAKNALHFKEHYYIIYYLVQRERHVVFH